MTKDKVIITCAITGGASPAGNPFLPKTPKEQVTASVDAFNAGASVIHIHGRNSQTGMPDHDARFLADAIGPIKQRCPGIIFNVTTGGSGRRCDGDHLYQEDPKESVKGRISVIPELCKTSETKPDLASLNAGSPLIDIYSKSKDEFLLKFVVVQTFPDMVHMATVMKAHGVKPELECYEVGMINNALILKEMGGLMWSYCIIYLFPF